MEGWGQMGRNMCEVPSNRIVTSIETSSQAVAPSIMSFIINGREVSHVFNQYRIQYPLQTYHHASPSKPRNLPAEVSTAFQFYAQQWLLQCPDRGSRLKGRDSSKEESEGCVAIVCRDTSKEESDDTIQLFMQT